MRTRDLLKCLHASGSFVVLIQYDVAETISLEALRQSLGAKAPDREPSFTHPAPGYVRFEKFPVVEELEPVVLSSGERFRCRLKYFDYGVVSAELELPYSAFFVDVVAKSSRFTSATEIETLTLNLVRSRIDNSPKGVFIEPYKDFLSEEYYVVRVDRCLDDQECPRPPPPCSTNVRMALPR